MKVVTTDNGDVYIKDIISTAPLETWVKGHWEGKTITVPTHQYLYNVPEWGMVLFLDVFESDGVSYISTGETEITFTVDENTMTLNGTSDDGSHIIGVGGIYGDDEPAFAGIGDFSVVCTLQEGGIPEDAVAKEYTLEASCSNSEEEGGIEKFEGDVTVYRSGDKVFFEGLFSEYPEGVAEGTMDDTGKVTFAKGQVLGSSYGIYLYLIGSSATIVDYEGMTDMTDVVFVYDKDADTYTLETPSIVLNCSKDKPDPLSYYTKCVLKTQTTGISASASAGSAVVNYYDLAGKRIAQPKKGVVIKKVQHADGTATTSKMVVK